VNVQARANIFVLLAALDAVLLAVKVPPAQESSMRALLGEKPTTASEHPPKFVKMIFPSTIE
jgi:hypothetical protein